MESLMEKLTVVRRMFNYFLRNSDDIKSRRFLKMLEIYDGVICSEKISGDFNVAPDNYRITYDGTLVLPLLFSNEVSHIETRNIYWNGSGGVLFDKPIKFKLYLFVDGTGVGLSKDGIYIIFNEK